MNGNPVLRRHLLPLAALLISLAPSVSAQEARLINLSTRAQTGAEYATELLALGVRRFRIEFVDEDAATVTRTLERYQALLDGKITGTELWNDLKVLNQLGVTRGTLRVRV